MLYMCNGNAMLITVQHVSMHKFSVLQRFISVVGKQINMHRATHTYFTLATVRQYQRHKVLFLFCNKEQGKYAFIQSERGFAGELELDVNRNSKRWNSITAPRPTVSQFYVQCSFILYGGRVILCACVDRQYFR